jgi:hypothetical protein
LRRNSTPPSFGPQHLRGRPGMGGGSSTTSCGTEFGQRKGMVRDRSSIKTGPSRGWPPFFIFFIFSISFLCLVYVFFKMFSLFRICFLFSLSPYPRYPRYLPPQTYILRVLFSPPRLESGPTSNSHNTGAVFFLELLRTLVGVT